jgi:hypothetical protein
MLVDCGGGTLDITVHEFIVKPGQGCGFCLQELHKATGGPFGSLAVDSQFEQALMRMFGQQFVESYRRKYPCGYLQLMNAFEARKRQAGLQLDSYCVCLPFSFICEFQKTKRGAIEPFVRRYSNSLLKSQTQAESKLKDHPALLTYCAKQGALRMHALFMQMLFRPVLDKITHHIRHVLCNLHVQQPNKPVQSLYLVGGFAESPLLQNAIERILNDLKVSVKLIVPQALSSATVRGAVLFGLQPSVVSMRRSRLTYGIGVLNHFRPEAHPIDKLVVRHSLRWCTDVFDQFVLCEQPLARGECVRRSYTPAGPKQTRIELHVYCSERTDAQFVTDKRVSRCGSLVLQLPPLLHTCRTASDNHPSSSVETTCSACDHDRSAHDPREILTEMTFGDTEITVTALDLSTGKSVHAEIDFLSQ